MEINLTWSEQFKIWCHVALHSFGGPAGQIAVIHKLVVEDKKLISEERFLHALNFCMLLPGPEAQQLATYIGWLLGKWRGGLLAGGLFILPGFLSILGLSYLYVLMNDLKFVQGIFFGIKPAVIAIVMAALWRISQKSLKTPFSWLLAASAFGALFFANVSFPWVIVGAAVAGLALGAWSSTPQETLTATERPRLASTLQTLFVWLGVWAAPIVLVLMIFGAQSTFHQMNIFFSKMALVTFGGAYAALTYVAQQAVEVFQWMDGKQMLDGLAMAESTPGPLIQTVQFVGFMGAYKFPDIDSSLLAATIASVLVTWMTFAPCFLWIFTFAPYVEFLRGIKALRDVLSAITAAVVGVILNLALWFTLQTLFPESAQLDISAALLLVLALVLQFAFKAKLFTVLASCALAGIVIQFI
jgi:chromate transporter